VTGGFGAELPALRGGRELHTRRASDAAPRNICARNGRCIRTAS
jgi:hypothetical protein